MLREHLELAAAVAVEAVGVCSGHQQAETEPMQAVQSGSEDSEGWEVGPSWSARQAVSFAEGCDSRSVSGRGVESPAGYVSPGLDSCILSSTCWSC